MIDTNIILIGLLAAGKTTVGKLLGAALGLPTIELDELRWDYYAEIGYDPDHAQRLRREGGIQARGAYSKPFEIYGVERLLEDYPSGYVLPLGAGNSVYTDPAHFERVQKAFAPYPYVVLLLPSADAAESLRITMERFRALVPGCPADDLAQVEELNRRFIEHPSNASLATRTIYTKDQSASETCAAIIAALG